MTRYTYTCDQCQARHDAAYTWYRTDEPPARLCRACSPMATKRTILNTKGKAHAAVLHTMSIGNKRRIQAIIIAQSHAKRS